MQGFNWISNATYDVYKHKLNHFRLGEERVKNQSIHIVICIWNTSQPHFDLTVSYILRNIQTVASTGFTKVHCFGKKMLATFYSLSPVQRVQLGKEDENIAVDAKSHGVVRKSRLMSNCCENIQAFLVRREGNGMEQVRRQKEIQIRTCNPCSLDILYAQVCMVRS